GRRPSSESPDGTGGSRLKAKKSSCPLSQAPPSKTFRLRPRVEKRLQLARCFAAETRHLRDLLDRGHPNPLNRTELFQERGFASSANSRKFIENAFGNSLQTKLGIIGIGHPMRFIPNSLQQFQGIVVMAQSKRFRCGWPIDFF